MPRFTINADFDLVTEIEPEFSRYSWDSSDVQEFFDGSYFQREEIRSSGGDLRFVVEAESEEQADEKVRDIIYEGQEVEDGSGLAWTVESLNVEIELIEEPMTLDRAREILTKLAEGREEEEIADAVEFVFAHIAELSTQIGRLITRATEADARITELSKRLQDSEPSEVV